jgi:hypothetical protein
MKINFFHSFPLSGQPISGSKPGAGTEFAIKEVTKENPDSNVKVKLADTMKPENRIPQ